MDTDQLHETLEQAERNESYLRDRLDDLCRRGAPSLSIRGAEDAVAEAARITAKARAAWESASAWSEDHTHV